MCIIKSELCEMLIIVPLEVMDAYFLQWHINSCKSDARPPPLPLQRFKSVPLPSSPPVIMYLTVLTAATKQLIVPETLERKSKCIPNA